MGGTTTNIWGEYVGGQQQKYRGTTTNLWDEQLYGGMTTNIWRGPITIYKEGETTMNTGATTI